MDIVNKIEQQLVTLQLEPFKQFKLQQWPAVKFEKKTYHNQRVLLIPIKSKK